MSLLKKTDQNPEKQDWLSSQKREAKLSIDLYETKSSLVVQSTISGIKAKNLDISVENEMLIIKGSRTRPQEELTEREYLYQECYWGNFSRKVTLPEEVDPLKIKASIDDGVLTITIPKIKKEEKKKVKVVEK